ncbi:MAG: ATP-binding cassette domain-containing protein [bacterium]|nr:ATP-binding cassette domain-containing protein [bacterium]
MLMADDKTKPTIFLDKVSKSFITRQRPSGVKGLFSWGKKQVNQAVKGVSLTVSQGRIVGLIGPNGAGKTTLLKILTGIIHPDSGQVSVLGEIPHHRRPHFLQQIGFLMGNRNYLWWNLPAIDSYNLLKIIYQIPDDVFDQNLKLFSGFLDVGRYLYDKPIRELSLGERMRCQLLAVFLHLPKLVFLDEPTLGLDIIAQDKMRDFVKFYAARFKPTIVLTSHYLKDIEILAQQVVILNHGHILFNDSLSKLRSKVSTDKEIVFETILNDPGPVKTLIKKHKLSPYLQSINLPEITFIAPQPLASQLIQIITNNLPVSDIKISSIDIEVIIKRYFQNV